MAPRIVNLTPTAPVPVPTWMHLPLTVKGYRVSHDVAAAFASALQTHLDTVNIWTHSMGLLFYLSMVPYTLSALRANGASHLDVFCFTFYLLCGSAQMLFSVCYHLFRAVKELDSFYLTLDIWGILAMIGGSWLLGMSQGFHCAPLVGLAYLAAEVALLALGRALGSRAMAGRGSWEVYYVAMGAAVAFGVVPCVHVYLRCASAACARVVLRSVWGMFGNYCLGFLFFMARFPERLAPWGLFDILGHSHQWWHLFVFNAGRVWLLAMLEQNELKGRGDLGLPCGG